MELQPISHPGLMVHLVYLQYALTYNQTGFMITNDFRHWDYLVYDTKTIEQIYTSRNSDLLVFEERERLLIYRLTHKFKLQLEFQILRAKINQLRPLTPMRLVTPDLQMFIDLNDVNIHTLELPFKFDDYRLQIFSNGQMVVGDTYNTINPNGQHQQLLINFDDRSVLTTPNNIYTPDGSPTVRVYDLHPTMKNKVNAFELFLMMSNMRGYLLPYYETNNFINVIIPIDFIPTGLILARFKAKPIFDSEKKYIIGVYTQLIGIIHYANDGTMKNWTVAMHNPVFVRDLAQYVINRANYEQFYRLVYDKLCDYDRQQFVINIHLTNIGLFIKNGNQQQLMYLNTTSNQVKFSPWFSMLPYPVEGWKDIRNEQLLAVYKHTDIISINDFHPEEWILRLGLTYVVYPSKQIFRPPVEIMPSGQICLYTPQGQTYAVYQ